MLVLIVNNPCAPCYRVCKGGKEVGDSVDGGEGGHSSPLPGVPKVLRNAPVCNPAPPQDKQKNPDI